MKSILFAIVLICSAGCTLFRKTSKTNAVATHSSINQLEASQLVLKTAGKETQIFTYWNDSGFYQYQHIKEQVDQAGLNQMKSEDQQRVKETVAIKKYSPLDNWIFFVIAIAIVAAVLSVFRTYRK